MSIRHNLHSHYAAQADRQQCRCGPNLAHPLRCSLLTTILNVAFRACNRGSQTSAKRCEIPRMGNLLLTPKALLLFLTTLPPYIISRCVLVHFSHNIELRHGFLIELTYNPRHQSWSASLHPSSNVLLLCTCCQAILMYRRRQHTSMDLEAACIRHREPIRSELFEVLVKTRCIYPSHVSHPPHESPAVDVEHLRRFVSDDATALTQVMPQLRHEIITSWGWQEEGVDVAPNSKALNVLAVTENGHVLRGDVRNGRFQYLNGVDKLPAWVLRLMNGAHTNFGLHVSWLFRGRARDMESLGTSTKLLGRMTY